MITHQVLQVTGPNRNEWVLGCTDYTYYADNAIVTGSFFGLTVDQIVIALTRQANCGITASPLAQGGFVAPGPQLASFVLNWTTLSDAWRKLAQLAGQVTPYGCYVDERRNLHFYSATTAQSSGVIFTTSPTVAGSTVEGHIALDFPVRLRMGRHVDSQPDSGAGCDTNHRLQQRPDRLPTRSSATGTPPRGRCGSPSPAPRRSRSTE